MGGRGVRGPLVEDATVWNIARGKQEASSSKSVLKYPCIAIVLKSGELWEFVLVRRTKEKQQKRKDQSLLFLKYFHNIYLLPASLVSQSCSREEMPERWHFLRREAWGGERAIMRAAFLHRPPASHHHTPGWKLVLSWHSCILATTLIKLLPMLQSYKLSTRMIQVEYHGWITLTGNIYIPFWCSLISAHTMERLTFMRSASFVSSDRSSLRHRARSHT